MVLLFWFDDRERDGFAAGNAFEDPENAFGIAPTESGRHAIFEHFDEILVEHLCFIVAGVAHRLLLLEALELVERIVQFRITITELGTGDHGVDALSDERIIGVFFRKWRKTERLISEPKRAGGVFAQDFPERIERTRSGESARGVGGVFGDAGELAVGGDDGIDGNAVVLKDGEQVANVRVENVNIKMLIDQFGVFLARPSWFKIDFEIVNLEL